MSIENQSGSPYVKYKTGITYNDNQLVYVSITVDDNISTWFWRGLLWAMMHLSYRLQIEEILQ